MERWSQGPNVRDQGLKKSETKAKNRPSRGQEQKCSRPRLRTKDTILQVCSPKKKKKKKKGNCGGTARFWQNFRRSLKQKAENPN